MAKSTNEIQDKMWLYTLRSQEGQFCLAYILDVFCEDNAPPPGDDPIRMAVAMGKQQVATKLKNKLKNLDINAYADMIRIRHEAKAKSNHNGE